MTAILQRTCTMKTIGLLGGMSWESTLEYYRALNRGVQQALGGLHSARIVMHSVDFAPLEKLMQAGRWYELAQLLGDAAVGLEAAGADFLLICTNTMHKIAPEIEARLAIPLVHIADATAGVLVAKKINKAALLGTSFTMEEGFYRQRLTERYGLEVLIPDAAARETINRVIFDELCRGIVSERSRDDYCRIIDQMIARGAEAVILGCTEIGMLLGDRNFEIELVDTTAVHASRAVALALEGVSPVAE